MALVRQVLRAPEMQCNAQLTALSREQPVHQDPFVHLPDLRSNIMLIADSTMRFTQDALAERDTRMREMGYAANWRQSDAALARAWR